MNLAVLPRARWPWPLPALAAWALAWGGFALLRDSRPGLAVLLALALAAAMALAWPQSTWRRVLILAGTLASLLAGGAQAAWPSALWLLPLAALLLIYPVQTWRDAPLFPTPARALQGLAEAIAWHPGAAALDAGCGLGHGLRALRQALPGAQVQGIERSRPLAWLARQRCPWASVQQGDMWRASWRGQQLVYLFQRPESMARAWAKAQAEMAPGSWLASLEFAVPGRSSDAALHSVAGKPVWLYRVPAPGEVVPSAQPGRRTADKFSERAPLGGGSPLIG